MAFKKGQKKLGGRKPGTPNKITSDVRFTLERLKCDPIEGMARMANDKKLEPALRLRAYAELAQYQYPKRRAVEITPGKIDPSGARLVPLDVLMQEFHQARLAADKTALPGKPSAVKK